MSPKSKTKDKKGRDVPLQIRLTQDEKTKFTEAAEQEHQTLSAWLRLAGWHAIENRHRLAVQA